MAHTPEELDMLTDEERAGLEEPETDEEALKAIAGEEEDEGGEEEEKPADEEEKAEEEAAEAGEEEKEEEKEAAEEEPAAEIVDDVPAMEPPRAPAAFDYDAKEDEYQQAVLDGEKEKARSIRAEIRAAEKAEAKYDAEVAAFNMIQEREVATAKANWNRDVNHFLKTHREYRENDVLFDALDSTIKRLAKNAEFARLSGPVALEEAHKQVQAAFGRAAEAPKKEEPKEEKPKSERPKVPTLGAVPSAAPEDTGRDEFGHLDELAAKDPEAYEEALSKLSPAQQQKYLRG